MKYSIEILPQALDNIESAYRWIADNLSADVAEQWYGELLTAINSLEKFPNRAAQSPEAIEMEQDIRQLFVGKARRYRILFLVFNGCVSVLYVRHSTGGEFPVEIDEQKYCLHLVASDKSIVVRQLSISVLSS
jgi:plasmid stabilization system protein ParE